MRKTRRINILVIFIALLALVFAFNFNANVNAYDYPNEFTNQGATYRVKERTAEKDLGFGVFYHRDISTLKINAPGFCNSAAAGSDGGTFEIGKEYGQQVNVLEIAPSEEVELVPYAYLSKSNWHASSVRDAAAQYESTHPGQRVVAAINGDFFQIQKDVKASTGATVGQGEFYKAQSSHSEGQNIAILNNGSGKQLQKINVNNSELVPTITIYDENGVEIKKFENAKTNALINDGEYGFHFAQRVKNYLSKMYPCTVSNVWYVDKAAETTAVTAIQNSFYGKGKITDYVNGEITFGEGAFAIESKNEELNKYLKKGVTVRCQYEFGGAYRNIKAAIGFPFTVMENGTAINNDTNRHPRTVIGQREDGTMILTVIDGRQRSKDMYGATCIEMAALMSYYGCVDAWNLDGGGSSTLLVRKQNNWTLSNAFNEENNLDSSWYVTNSPSDGSERRDGNCLLIVAKVPDIRLSIAEVTNNTVKINVAQLTTIEKYKELYLMINNQMYKVENGVVVCDNLKSHENYTGFLYAKVDGKMVNLMSDISFLSAYDYIKELEIEAVIRERKDEDYILIKYKTDSREGIENIYFMVGEERYGTANPAIYIAQSTDIYDALLNIDVTIIFKGSPIKDNELLEFKNVKVNVDTDFALNEIKFRNNDVMDEIFKLK